MREESFGSLCRSGSEKGGLSMGESVVYIYRLDRWTSHERQFGDINRVATTYGITRLLLSCGGTPSPPLTLPIP
jgi:hypothetical protein